MQMIQSLLFAVAIFLSQVGAFSPAANRSGGAHILTSSSSRTFSTPTILRMSDSGGGGGGGMEKAKDKNQTHQIS